MRLSEILLGVRTIREIQTCAYQSAKARPRPTDTFTVSSCKKSIMMIIIINFLLDFTSFKHCFHLHGIVSLLFVSSDTTCSLNLDAFFY